MLSRPLFFVVERFPVYESFFLLGKLFSFGYGGNRERWMGGYGREALIGVQRGVTTAGENICAAGLECLLNILRALRMGSCLSTDGGGGRGGNMGTSSPSASSPSSPKAKRQRKVQWRAAERLDEGVEDRAAQLHRIPGRMFLNGASDMASMFTQQGEKGTNQDAMIFWENFSSRKDTLFCGVFDGHGPYGHLVARRVRDLLPLKLSKHWEFNLCGDCEEKKMNKVGSIDSDEGSSIRLGDKCNGFVDLNDEENHLEFLGALKESFLEAFNATDKELKMHPSIDSFCSGTTAVALVKQGRDLVIGNVGDSRAVMGTRDDNGCLIAVQLTVDLKPNLPREAERIRLCKGRVFALQNEPEVPRIWLPNYDSPGLAMARALGDFCLKDFGLISEPEMSHRHLTKKDEFVVLATDGVWDVLSNEEAVDIVAAAPSRPIAARHLVESVTRAWKLKYPSAKVDDCAAVCLFLDPDCSITSHGHRSENHPEECFASERLTTTNALLALPTIGE